MAKHGKESGKKGKVGSDYPEDRYRIGWGAGLDHWGGSEKGKTVHSPNGTTFEPDISVHEGYGKLWEGK